MHEARRILNLVITLTIGAILALTMTGPLYSRLEPATLFYDVNGVDVSHHQGEIDWRALANDKVTFAFMKATEGSDFKDRSFAGNWRGAKEAGIATGAYHFFTRCSSPKAQAANFIKTVPQDDNALPPVVDAEHMGPCKNGEAREDMAEGIGAFLDILHKHYGKRPLIYTTREFHDAFLKGRLKDEKFWIRSLFLPPRFRRESWLFWQHHHHGRRKGVTCPVDLNVFRGSREEFENLLHKPYALNPE